MALISIILPTYNGEKYIAYAIESCLAQTMPDFELIIVNDSSTDSTPSIIQAFAEKDSRITVISNESNLQLPRSLNKGFSKASGKYLTWTSDDNYYAPNALAILTEELEKHSDIDIVYSSYRFINENNKILETFGGEPENLLFKCIPGACFLYRNVVHEKLKGYAEDKFRTEDMDFWLRAAVLFRFKYIDHPDLYYYRKHKDSLTFNIYKNDEIYAGYRKSYIDSFRTFFNDGLHARFSSEEIELHIEIFFDNLNLEDRRDFDLTDKVLLCLQHFDKLRSLPWEDVHFDKNMLTGIISEKRNRIVGLIMNDLIFDIKRLKGQNPSIAGQLNKPLSWYYQEYEVLPLWYKRFGHILKIFQKNRATGSFISKKVVK